MMGPHILNSTAQALAWAGRAGIVKSLNAQALRSAQAGAVTVFRCYFTDQEQDAANAQYSVNKILGQLGGFRPTYVSLYNEWRQKVGQGLESHVDFVSQCVPLLHSQGIKVAAYDFSTGNPEMTDWQYLQSRGYGGADAIGIHEYWPGQTGNFSTWNALRYRRAHQAVGGNHPPFIITECGADAVEGGSPGWKLSGISGSQYVSQLLAYKAQTEQDGYVIGCTPFTAGASGTQWGAFDTDEISDQISGNVVTGNGNGNALTWPELTAVQNDTVVALLAAGAFLATYALLS